MEPYATILTALKEKTEKTLKHTHDQLGQIRTGRASPALVDTIRVEYYGTPTPLNQVAHISVPEARQLMIKPFDGSPQVMKDIERAIQKSDLGLNPQSDGKVLRLAFAEQNGHPFRPPQRTRTRGMTEGPSLFARGLDIEFEAVAESHMPTVPEVALRASRIEHLLYIAEYKRRQAAPGVKITRKNFGRDRRYPITNRFRDRE